MDGRRFDIFLSYHSADKVNIERIAQRLRQTGIEPWLDQWHLTPGGIWQQELIQGLRASRACAVFVGRRGLGDWAREELAVAQDRAAKDRSFRLFMVLLPGAPDLDDPVLAFLRSRTWVDLRSGIADPDGFKHLISAVTGVARHPPLPAEGEGICPYRGLEVFEESHARFFFGREDDTARVVEKLKASRFLAVLGPSGSGKSSLVRAGVAPAIKRGALPGSQAWTIRLFTPGPRPLSVLAAQLVRLYPEGSMQATLDEMRADERAADLAVSLALADRPADERVVLVVDQLEEVFTLCADEDERRSFLANLCYAAAIPGGRLVVIAAMRADFYHRCATYSELRGLVADQQFLVGPLGPEGLRQVIEEPARQVGLELEAGLAETILADVKERPGTLPLLEHVLLELWEGRQGRLLTLEAYVARGRAEGALAQRANAVYRGFTSTRREIARRVLLRLTQPGEGTEDTRRRATMTEILTQSGEQDDLDAVIKALADRRLLTTGRDEVTGEPVVDIAHEALIRAWPELQGWIGENREALRAHRRLTESAGEWDQGGREEALLYRGARLVSWEERDLKDLNDLERDFLDASHQRERRERNAARRRVRLTVIGLSLALALISAAAILVLVQRNEARARQFAAEARVQLLVDPNRSLTLALRAFEITGIQEAETILRQATIDPRKTAILSGHLGAILSVAFSPDGKLVVSAGADGTVRVWEWARSGVEPVVLRGHEAVVTSVAFSPDGKLVVSAGRDGTVRVWEWARRGVEPVVLRGDQDTISAYSAAFSPDGKLVVGTGYGTQVWEWASKKTLAMKDYDDYDTLGAAFSPDGKLVVSAGTDGTVRVWEWARSGVEPVALRGHEGSVQGAAFSPDAKLVVSAGGDGIVRVWDCRVACATTEEVLRFARRQVGR